MKGTHEIGRAGVRAALALLMTVGATTDALAQGFGLAGESGSPSGEVLFSERILQREYSSEVPLLEGRYIVVQLTENRVFVFEDGKAIWSAQSGTGTGLAPEYGGQQWEFHTPQGLMRVKRMERDPLWEAPDWHFQEDGLPVPPRNSPRRLIPGGMGTTAIYLGDGIAIHGTERPELLMDPDPEARRVSHGCIRLTNEHARELMHMVEVGTPVLLFGTVNVEGRG